MEQDFVIPRSSDDIIIVTNNITVGSDPLVTVYAKFDGTAKTNNKGVATFAVNNKVGNYNANFHLLEIQNIILQQNQFH